MDENAARTLAPADDDHDDDDVVLPTPVERAQGLYDRARDTQDRLGWADPDNHMEVTHATVDLARVVTDLARELRELARESAPAPEEDGQWWHCSPALLATGVDCAETTRRPCECLGAGSHDHYVRGATCRHQGPWVVDPQCISETASTLRWRPAPSYEIQGSGYAPDPFEWPTDGVRDIYDPRETR